MLNLESINFPNTNLIQYHGGKMLGNFITLSNKLMEINFSNANIS